MSGIMMSTSTMSMSGVRSRTATPSAPLLAEMTLRPPRSSSVVIAKMLPKSSSTTRTLLPASSGPAGRSGGNDGRGGGSLASLRDRRGGVTVSTRREVYSERAALPGRAGERDLAAEQGNELSADREAQSGAAVLAGSYAVGLGEGLEDAHLQLRGHADAGVADLKCGHVASSSELVVRRTPTILRPAHAHGHLSALGKLEGVGEEVGQYLAQAVGVGGDGRCNAGQDFHREGQVLLVGDGAELVLEGFLEIDQLYVADLERDGARFDLGEVKDIVEEAQQIGARGLMMVAYCSCSSVRFSVALAFSSPARISRLLSGVRSSCDMLEKNSDLNADETASCSAFSSTRRLARSTSWFLASTSMFCSARRLACLARSSLELRRSSWRDCSSWAWDWACLSRFSVRVLASIVLSTSPMLSVSWSRNAW